MSQKDNNRQNSNYSAEPLMFPKIFSDLGLYGLLNKSARQKLESLGEILTQIVI